MLELEAKVFVGDNRKVLKRLPDQSVHCVVTSPPYWGLRDYGTANWVGGDSECSHRRESKKSDKTITGHKNFTEMLGVGDAIYKDSCPRCGAVREDEQIGLEVTPDEYVEELCKVFDEVWRVLRDDGTLWLNLGDSYASGKLGRDDSGDGGRFGGERLTPKQRKAPEGFKPKDLVGIPWRVAFALQQRGWYLRQDIIWAKPNPMPESVTDRCTKSHEYIFLLSKSARYYFDNEAIKEEGVIPAGTKAAKGSEERQNQSGVNSRPPEYKIYDGMRNKRDVWTVATKPYAEAHFATYPAELIKPCVLAGTSEKGACIECGKPWERIVDGWQKVCDCVTQITTPCVVLDPFSGSGTTGEVALLNGRDYVGTELNPEYAELSRKRISEAVGLFGEVEVVYES